LNSQNFTFTIGAPVVAWYAAIMSTVIAAVQTANYFRDRVGVQVSFQRDMEMVNDVAHAGMTITMVTVVNTGRRRLTITTVTARRLSGKSWVFGDAVPPLPCVLEEGAQIQVIVNQQGLDFGDISAFTAHDAAGHVFPRYVAPWYRRTYWAIRRKVRGSKSQ
jgi:hypothetical protein